MKTELSPVRQKFVLHWGEMGARWGINRTVAQIHALLYLSPEPLNAEQISDALELARSNVSTSLRELQNWNIIHIVHVRGDRRDHFESLKDPFEMFRVILNERKRREVDPTVNLIRSCLTALQEEKKPEAYVEERLTAMIDFFELMSDWYDQLNRLPTGAVVKFVRLGEKAFKLVS